MDLLSDTFQVIQQLKHCFATGSQAVTKTILSAERKATQMWLSATMLSNSSA